MRTVLFTFLMVSVSALILQAQTEQNSLPKIEVFGGYSYLNRLTYHNTPGDNPEFHGWEASVDYNFNKWVGLKADFSGHYNHSLLSSNELSEHDFALGPQLSWRLKQLTPFAHGLVGISHKHYTIENFQTPASKYAGESFTAIAGGGVDWNITKQVGWRIGQIDYQRSGGLENGGPINGLRVATGIVFRLGTK